MERANLNPFGLSAPQYDPVAFGKMKADTINSTSGDLTGCDCPKCLNRGNIAVPKEDGGVSIRECDCMKIRRCVWEMERSGLKNIIREKTFDTYTVAELKKNLLTPSRSSLALSATLVLCLWS